MRKIVNLFKCPDIYQLEIWEMFVGWRLTYFICIIGLVGNLTNFITLHIYSMHSLVTNCLLRSQCIWDFITILIVLGLRATGLTQTRNSGPLDTFLCYIWYSSGLLWLFVILSGLNMTCISLDRLIAIKKPIFYITRRKFLLILFYTSMALYTLILIVPRITPSDLNKHICGDTKHFKVGVHRLYYAIFWTLFTLVIPVLTIIVVQIVIIVDLRRRVTQNDQEQQTNTKEPINHRQTIIQSLCLTTTLIGISDLAARIFELIHYFMRITGTGIFSRDDDFHQLAISLIALSGCSNPFILCITVPSLFSPIFRGIRRINNYIKR